MPLPPNRLIEEAFLAPTVEIVRRAEIYERDGTTPWKAEIWPNILVGGTVSVDAGNDSRRSLDCQFYNFDGQLVPEAGEFWYDKVIKIFYGIITHQEDHDPAIVIVEEYNSTGQALALKRLLSIAGVRFVDYNPLAETLDDVADYDILISISSDYTRKLSFLTQAYNAGKSVVTFNPQSTAAQLPYIISGSGSVRTGDVSRNFTKEDQLLDEVQSAWSTPWSLSNPQPYRPITSVLGSVVAYEQTNAFGIGAALIEDKSGAVWVHVAQADFVDTAFATAADKASFASFLGAVFMRADAFDAVPVWESQIGEFIPDGISDGEETMNNLISFTARDYAKRCQQAKLSKATMFKSGDKIVDIVRAIARNCGITKYLLPDNLSTTLGKDTTWERDTERWEIMKAVATANNYDIWFDAEGYLRMTKQQDPLLTAATLNLTTGSRGNLISRGRKTSDAGLYNKVTVTGESSDSTTALVYGEASNTDPNSPSSIPNIGERTKNISSPLVTSDLQALELAKTYLSVAGLEEFEMNFSSILFPWAEVGEIVEMAADDERDWGPGRYLLTSISMPLDLSPMSGTGKRVTKF